MAEKYFGGTLPAEQEEGPEDAELIEMASGLRNRYEEAMEKYALQSALQEVFKLISRANKYIDETSPWILAKDEAKKPRLARVIYNLLEVLRITGMLLSPFMPESSEKLFKQVLAGGEARTWDSLGTWGGLRADASVARGEALFPRLDMEKELAALENSGKPKAEPEAAPISIDDFAKVEMIVCKVVSCENVPKSKKLLRFTLDDGSGEKRQILSGIAEYYKPETLVGKTVVACTNLAPRMMMGYESCGMLLSAEKDGVLNLMILPDDVPAGSRVC
jgi:methionyl-tRNA synthetase